MSNGASTRSSPTIKLASRSASPSAAEPREAEDDGRDCDRGEEQRPTPDRRRVVAGALVITASDRPCSRRRRAVRTTPRGASGNAADGGHDSTAPERRSPPAPRRRTRRRAPRTPGRRPARDRQPADPLEHAELVDLGEEDAPSARNSQAWSRFVSLRPEIAARAEIPTPTPNQFLTPAAEPGAAGKERDDQLRRPQ